MNHCPKVRTWLAVVGLVAVAGAADAFAVIQPFGTIGGGATTDKLRFDPGGAANQGGEVGRFWQSTNSNLGNNFGGGCPSLGSGGGWWKSSQAPLRGIQGWLDVAECETSGTPAGNMTIVVEEPSAAGDLAFFVAVRVDETPGAVRWWDFSRVDPSPSPSVLPMVALPSPMVVAAWNAPEGVTLEFVFPDVAAAVHAVSSPWDMALPASAVVASYYLYRTETGTDPGRDASLWTLVHQEPYADGPGHATLTVPCDSDHGYALGLSFEGGAGPDVPSAFVGRPFWMECGLDYPIYGIGVIDFGPGRCIPGELPLLHDLCTGGSIDLFSSDIDFSTHACEFVELEGQQIITDECTTLVMSVETLTPAAAPCLVQVRGLGLEATPAALALTWEPMPCTDSYDLIRGTLPVTADLGAVTCLADDVPAAAAEDATGVSPAPGETFFYLVRANGAIGSASYGYASGGEPRFPASGDCP